jgi:23S rRNA (guanosine2251-2'-O)-methyltransferase
MRGRNLGRHSFSPSGSPRQGKRDRVICGMNAVQEALRVSASRLERIWVAEGKAGRRLNEVLALAAERGTAVEIVPEPRLTEASGTSAHQGIVAFSALSPLLTLDQLIAQLTARPTIPPLALLDGLKDPQNLGAIIRSAAAFGIGGIIVPTRRAVGLTGTVAKVAAGGLEHVPVAEVTNISQSIERLKQHGFWVIGSDERAEATCDSFVYPSPLALVFGEEEAGISPLVKRHCDALVRIPVCGPLHSLNVAVAAAVLFYEVMVRAQGEGVGSRESLSKTPPL